MFYQRITIFVKDFLDKILVVNETLRSKKHFWQIQNWKSWINQIIFVGCNKCSLGAVNNLIKF